MICQLAADGFCARHGRKHTGEELRYATEDSVIGEGFRKGWDYYTVNPAQISEPVAVRGICRHLDEAPIDKGGCGSCQAKWVYPCDLYGRASPEGYHSDAKRCGDCIHYAARNSELPEPKPRRLVLVNECCPGDVLVSTAAIESLHAAHPGRFITAVKGTATDIFDYNPHVAPNLTEIDGERVEWEEVPMNYPLVDYCDARPVHFMQGYCEWLAMRLGVPVPLTVNRPYVYLSPDERGWISQVQETAGRRVAYWLINAGYKNDYPAKWWGASNYQRVVDLLRGKVLFVQIGEAAHNHPQLGGVLDMRGKTDTRQFLRLVFHSSGGVGPSTFLQHACAAFEKPYVCIAGGREPLAWQHYPRQATLSTIGVTSCGPSRQGRSCWRDRTLPDAAKPAATLCELPVLSGGGEWVPACLESIRPERVAEEILLRYNNGTRFS